MPTFGYKAMSTDGREVSGALDAADARSAAAALRERSLYVLSLAPGGTSGGAPAARGETRRSAGTATSPLADPLRWVTRLRPITSADRVAFFRQLALMQRSGLTLIEGLRVVREQSSKARMADAVDRVMTAIQSGRTFTDALAQERRVFPPFAVKLVRSAEASGELDVVLERIAGFLERQAELRTNLLTSLTYPAIVVVASLSVAIFLVVQIIPRFSRYLTQRSVALPWSAQLLMDFSSWLSDNATTLITAFALLVGGLVAMWFWPRGRLVLDRVVLRIPVIGGVLMASSLATFGRTMGMLLRSGVSLLDGLRLARQLSGNRLIADRLHQAGEDILGGRDLAGALDPNVFPPAVTQIVAVGEKTGSLSEVLDELGDFYDRQLETAIKRMSALIEPAMILTLGVMVGFVYFAFFQAVFRLATAAR